MEDVDDSAPLTLHSHSWKEDDGSDEEAEEEPMNRRRSRSFYISDDEEEEGDPQDFSGFDPVTMTLKAGKDAPAESPTKSTAEDSGRSLKQREIDALNKVKGVEQESESKFVQQESAQGLEDAEEEHRARTRNKTRGGAQGLDSDSGEESAAEIVAQQQRRMAQAKMKKIKLLMLGDIGVGKTSLMTRWTADEFNSNLISTAGVDFKTKEIEAKDQKVQVQIWDTAGQERFHMITYSYYRGCNGILLIFDPRDSDVPQMQRLEYWLSNIKKHAGRRVEVALLCNKIDMVEDGGRSSHNVKAGSQVSKKQSIPLFLTSAKTGEGVDEAFMDGCESNPGSRRDGNANANLVMF